MQTGATGPALGLYLNERVDMGKVPEVDNFVGDLLDGVVAFRAEGARRFQRIRQRIVIPPSFAILQKRKFVWTNM